MRNIQIVKLIVMKELNKKPRIEIAKDPLRYYLLKRLSREGNDAELLFEL